MPLPGQFSAEIYRLPGQPPDITKGGPSSTPIWGPGSTPIYSELYTGQKKGFVSHFGDPHLIVRAGIKRPLHPEHHHHRQLI